MNGAGWSRTLAGLVLVLGLAGAAAGVVLPLNQLTQPGGAVPVRVADPVDRAIEVRDLPAGAYVEVHDDDALLLQASSLPAPLRALTEASAFARGLLAAVAAWLLRLVLLDVAAGRPFADEVPRRLLGLSLVAAAWSFVPEAVASAATVAVLTHLGITAADSAVGFTILSLDLGMLVVAGVVAVTASVFRHGAQLERDVEGLV